MKVTRRNLLGFAAAIIALAGWTGSATAEYPEKPIQFIIPFGAGGGADIEGRLLADEMSKVLGVSVVPVNKPGAGGAVTYSYVKEQPADGYTVAWASTSLLTTTNIGNVKFRHDAFDHLGQVEYQPMPLAVRADAPWQTFGDFVAACKAAPGTLKISNSGTGSATHVAAIALENAIDCPVIHLPVGVKRNNATVLSGEADAVVNVLTGLRGLSRAGKLRLLVIPSAERNSVIPDVPTARELGYEAVFDLFRSLSVAKNTPPEIKAKLQDAMIKAATSPAFTKLSMENGFTVAPLTGRDFDAKINGDDKIVRDVMIKAGLYQSKGD